MLEGGVLPIEIDIRAQRVRTRGVQGDLGQPVVGRRHRLQRVGLQRLPALHEGSQSIAAGAAPGPAAADGEIVRQLDLGRLDDLRRKIGEVGVVRYPLQVELPEPAAGQRVTVVEEVGVALFSVLGAVVRQILRAGLAQVGRLEIAELPAHLHPALRHDAWPDRGIAVGRDIHEVGNRHLQPAGVGAPVVRRDEAGFALLVQRERQVGRVEDRNAEELDGRVAGDAEVARLVNFQLASTQVPVLLAGAAGGVLCALRAVTPRALEEYSLRLAAPIPVAELLPLAGGLGILVQRVGGFVHGTGVGFEVVPQPRAFHDVASPLHAHVALCCELAARLVIAQPIGEHRLPAPSQPDVALGFGIAVLMPLQPVRLEEKRHLLLRRRRHHEQRGLRLQLEPLLRASRQGQRA
jgi:hypothetical protein